MMTQATLSFEIEIGIEGTVEAYRPATRDDPAEGGYAEDVGILWMGVIEASRKPKHGGFEWETKSVMDGVNLASPDIQRLFSNILALKAQEAQEALLEQESDADLDREEY